MGARNLASVVLVALLSLCIIRGVSAYNFTDCCDSKLVHWFDFSDTSNYGTEAQSTLSSFVDNIGISGSHTLRGNVQYVPNVQNGLGAMFVHRDSFGCLQFSTASSIPNPEVILKAGRMY